MKFGIQGFMQEELIAFAGVSSQTIERLKHTPSSALGSCRYKLKQEDLSRVLELLRKYDIRYLFMVGGNDTMDTVHRIEAFCRDQGYELQEVGMKVVAIAPEQTLFPTLVIPAHDLYGPYLELAAGWNLLVEVGLALDIDLDRPLRARKIGNELSD